MNPSPNPAPWVWHPETDWERYTELHNETRADHSSDAGYSGSCDNCDRPFSKEPHETHWETSSAGDAAFCCDCANCDGDHE